MSASFKPGARKIRPGARKIRMNRKTEGCHIVLATASPRAWADAVAAHLGLFDDVIASDALMNLKGPKKLAALEEYQRNLGVERWGYVGDDHSDLCIVNAASACYVVGRKRSVLKHAEAVCTPTAVFRPKGSIGRAAIKALRPHQCMNNILVFIL